MEITPKDLEVIKKALDIEDLWIETDPQWCSSQPNFRQALRQALAMRLTLLLERNMITDILDKTAALGEIKTILSTKQLPVTTFSSQSISHCKDLGGFAITSQPTQIGFDLELTARLADEGVVIRISDEEELYAAPSPGHLWVGKEATFKALLGTYQPQVLSEICLSGWQQLTDNLHEFQFKLNNSNDLAPFGRGVVMLSDRLKMGLAAV